MKPEKLDLDNSIFTIRKLRFSDGIWNDDTVARLLSLLDSFYEDIEGTRSSLGLNNTVPYYTYNPDIDNPDYKKAKKKQPDLTPPATEKNLAPNHLFVLRMIVADKKLEQLDQLANKLVEKYKLPPRWQFPIEILILTDTLITPIHGQYYNYLNSPNALMRLPSEIDIQKSPETDPSKRFADKSFWLQPNLTIIVSQKISPSDLAKSILKDEEIKYGLSLLPDYPKPQTRRESNALYWGHLVWATFRYRNPNMDIKDVAELLQETKPKEDVPDFKQLEIYYKRFMDTKAQTGL